MRCERVKEEKTREGGDGEGLREASFNIILLIKRVRRRPTSQTDWASAFGGTEPIFSVASRTTRRTPSLRLRRHPHRTRSQIVTGLPFLRSQHILLFSFLHSIFSLCTSFFNSSEVALSEASVLILSLQRPDHWRLVSKWISPTDNR